MKKPISQTIHETDEGLVARVRRINNSADNIIGNSCFAVLKPEYLLKIATFGKRYRSSEHRVILIRKGSMLLLINHVDCLVSQGEVLFVPANSIVSIENFGGNVEPWLVGFGTVHLPEWTTFYNEPLHVRLDLDEVCEVEDYFRLLRSVLCRPSQDNSDFNHIVMSLLCRIHEVYSNNAPTAKRIAGLRPKQIKAAFFNLLFSTDPPERSVAYYAKKLNISANYLSIVIKQETSRTVISWVEEKLNTMAKMMLDSPENYTLEQIAERCGFATSNQVSRLFRKLNGITITEYRKTNNYRRHNHA